MADFPAVDYITTDNILQNFGGVKAYDGEANFSSAVRYQKQDILISNIRPYLKKIWIADKDGGCSPDVLVLKLVSDSYIPDFIYFALARQQFFDFVIMDVKGMKMPRGKKKHIMQYELPVVPVSKQKDIVAEISNYMRQIRTSKDAIDKCGERKRMVLEKYLN